ncbi:MAG: PKD domain-containing protein [bacterium]|nr:PKD domain-containing protein [bacterium]
MRRLLFAVFLILPLCCLAQRQNDVWYFGGGAGIDFSSGIPTPILGPFFTQEGTASVCDSTTGAFLFTTDGKTIYDRNLAPMPNGNNLIGGWSSTQSALIVPMPRAAGKYYVFTPGDLSNGTLNVYGLHYSVVDISLNGGLGDVETKNVKLLDTCAEKLHATRHCDGESYWVVAHDKTLPRFYMYKVTSRGVYPPVISNVGRQYVNAQLKNPGGNYGLGMIKFSASGNLLAMANPHSKVVEVFDVDLRRGRIFNPRLVDTARQFYGIAFSPSEELLYVTTWNEVLQYDVTSVPINTSRTVLGPIASASGLEFRGGIQRGPDGVIYVADSTCLRPIPFPDQRGAACMYIGSSPNVLRSPTHTLIGLPNIIDGQYLTTQIEPCLLPVADVVCDTIVCEQSCLAFENVSTTNVTRYTWEFQGGTPPTFEGMQPPTICFNTPGKFVVRLVAENKFGEDTIARTIHVVKLPSISAGADFTYCENQRARLNASGGERYSWSPDWAVSDPSSVNPFITDSSATTFIVTGWTWEGCMNVDTVIAEYLSPADLIINNVKNDISQNATFVIRHPANRFDSCDVSVLYNSKCMHDLTVSVGDELARGSVADGRNFIRMRLRKRPADNVIATFTGAAILGPVRNDVLECVVENSYGCRTVLNTIGTVEFSGCALNLRMIKVSANTMLTRMMYNVDGRVVLADEIQYDRWEAQPSMPSTSPAGLYIEILSIGGEVVHSRTFTHMTF